MARPLNILHISPFYPPHVGGLESHAAEFNQHLASSDIRITTLTPDLPFTGRASEEKNFLRIIRFPAWEIVPNYPIPRFWHTGFHHIWRHANDRSYDLVISRTRFFSTCLLAWWYAHRYHTPWLHIEHGADFVHLNNPLTSFLARLYDYTIGRATLRAATNIVANSHASAAFVKKLSGRTATVIYRGVDNESFSKTLPHSQLAPEKIKIVFAGRLIDGKGIKYLIHAAAELKKKSVPAFHIYIIGGGPQAQQLRRLSESLELQQHISFLGEQSRNNTIAILKAADIFVNPSFTEGLPTSIIEAALCHCAIIATNVGGTHEIVTDTISALLIPSGDITSLTHALEQLIKSPSLRNQLSTAAYKNVQNRFSWPSAMARYQQLFHEIASRAQRKTYVMER